MRAAMIAEVWIRHLIAALHAAFLFAERNPQWLMSAGM